MSVLGWKTSNGRILKILLLRISLLICNLTLSSNLNSRHSINLRGIRQRLLLFMRMHICIINMNFQETIRAPIRLGAILCCYPFLLHFDNYLNKLKIFLCFQFICCYLLCVTLLSTHTPFGSPLLILYFTHRIQFKP